MAATSIKKVGQAAQGNNHSSNLILICSHVRVRHLKSHQIEHLTISSHLNSEHSFTKPQHTAAIGRTGGKKKKPTEKRMAEEARRGTAKAPRCLCLIWTVCVQLHSTKNSLKLDHIHESCLDGGKVGRGEKGETANPAASLQGRAMKRKISAFTYQFLTPLSCGGSLEKICWCEALTSGDRFSLFSKDRRLFLFSLQHWALISFWISQ